MKKEEIAIKVENVSKTFNLPHENVSSIKSIIVKPFKRRGYEKQEVLKGIDFDIKKGEFFGIVGRNGSGKSTLLKLLAGIYSPDTGTIKVNGKLTPFIELGVGFNPELTGKENVYLNGALLGFNRKEMSQMYDEIVEFAELEKFMDQKLKNYSSGMQVRLAFSIAIQANSDILVLDEVLAVGDYNFQQKCFEYFRHLKKLKKTVILVSHDSNALQMFCTNGILLEKGVIKKRGKINSILKEYALQNQNDQDNLEKKLSKKEKSVEKGNGKVLLDSIDLLDNNNKKTKAYRPNEKIKIILEYKFSHDIHQPVFGLVIQDVEGGQPIFATNTKDRSMVTQSYKAGQNCTVKFYIDNIFNDGRYFISGAVASSDRSILYTRFINKASFRSVGWDVTAKARVYPEYVIEIES